MALKHVVVGGGTGFIGTRLIESLRHEGINCTTVSRVGGLQKLTWDQIQMNGLPSNTSAVINVSGQNVLDPTQRWTSKFKQHIRDSRIETTKILADAVANSSAKVFVTISGVAYYKPNTTTYTEETHCQPYDFLSELCHDWEAAAQISGGSHVRQATIRSGVVLGKGGGMIKQIYLPFFLGMGGPLGSGTQYMPWIHITDLINMFKFVLLNDNVCGILNGVAPQVITNHDFTKAFASAMQRPAFIPVPGFALNILFSEERAKMMLEGQKVTPKRVMDFGFNFCFPDIESACKDITL